MKSLISLSYFIPLYNQEVDLHFFSFPAQKVENRVASDEDLKLSDTLRYYMRDSNAAKNLLYRRRRCLANYETANKNLDKARAKNREVGAVSGTIFAII